jgi:Lrp/AsnC family transcriptional regulator, leucine-responsive regulatory protein
MIDDVDTQILTIVQQNARASNAEIARQVGMAPSAIYERLRKLEARGIIAGYEARLCAPALGLGLVAFIFVRADERVGEPRAGAQLAAIPEVQEVHHVAGEDCYLVKVRVANTEELSRLLRDRIGAIECIRSTRTTIVLTTVKETSQLPLAPAVPEAAHD